MEGKLLEMEEKLSTPRTGRVSGRVKRGDKEESDFASVKKKKKRIVSVSRWLRLKDGSKIAIPEASLSTLLASS